jgi:hypothetical protein
MDSPSVVRSHRPEKDRNVIRPAGQVLWLVQSTRLYGRFIHLGILVGTVDLVYCWSSNFDILAGIVILVLWLVPGWHNKLGIMVGWFSHLGIPVGLVYLAEKQVQLT